MHRPRSHSWPPSLALSELMNSLSGQMLYDTPIPFFRLLARLVSVAVSRHFPLQRGCYGGSTMPLLLCFRYHRTNCGLIRSSSVMLGGGLSLNFRVRDWPSICQSRPARVCIRSSHTGTRV